MFPGVVFTKPPKRFTITSAEQDIDFEEEAGLHLRIPADSLKQTESIVMTVATSFTGPFVLPDGVRAVSAIHIVKLSNDQVEFKKDVEVCIQHNALMEDKCTECDLLFMKAPSEPTISNDGPSYTFDIVKAVHVEVPHDKPNWGLVKVKNFCLCTIADKGQYSELHVYS